MQVQRRAVLSAAAGVAALSATPAAVAAVTRTYDPAGIYLDYDTRGNIAGGSNVKLDANGVIMVARGSSYVYNPTTIAQYGLQQFGYYVQKGTRIYLTNALKQAGWLYTNQDRATGRWNYDYPFGVGAMSETLPAGWGSAMAQGQAISLLTRIARLYPTSTTYIGAARRALWPLAITVANGGFLAYFQGRQHFEEYPTRTAPTLALNGFMFCLVGLHDLRTMGNANAEAMYQRGIATMRFELPYHDAVTTSAYHLGHLTKPARKIHHAPHYHRIHVMLLQTMQTFDPNPVQQFYADLWSTYPDMNPALYDSRGGDPLIGPGLDS